VPQVLKDHQVFRDLLVLQVLKEHKDLPALMDPQAHKVSRVHPV
jgi:hypothetical protein